MSSLAWERVYPYFFGGTAIAAVALLDKYGYKVSYNEAMLAAGVSLGGIFAGFLATVKTLLLTIGTEIRRALIESGYMHKLLCYLREGIYGSLALSLAAMLGFNAAMRWPSAHAAVLYGLLVFAILSLYRIARISFLLFNTQESD